jgi:hypothetical protein
MGRLGLLALAEICPLFQTIGFTPTDGKLSKAWGRRSKGHEAAVVDRNPACDARGGISKLSRSDQRLFDQYLQPLLRRDSYRP